MRVFISYSHEDKRIVRRLTDDLRQHGLTVWLDTELVLPGENWNEKLALAVQQADAVIVVMSRNTTVSQWQRSEIAYVLAAQKRDESKRLIPVLVDKEADPPFFLKTRVYCDLSDEDAYRKNFPLLIRSLREPATPELDRQELDRITVEAIKAERRQLMQMEEALAKKKAMRMTSVVGAMASVIAASLALLVGFLGNLPWNNQVVAFVIGAVAGVVATLAAFGGANYFRHKQRQSGGEDAE
ncbi:MAG: toll/interleukin-1 receptor domain-containing protein [Desulfomonilaceae bacterium]